MVADQSETTPATSGPAALDTEPVGAEGAALVGAVHWEFRLTADRRRILILVNPTSKPELL
jgi:hypothetical protein